MAEFLLNNNIFEFNSKVYQQKSGTAIGTLYTAICTPLCLHLHGWGWTKVSANAKQNTAYLGFYLDSLWTGTRNIFEAFKQFYP